VQNLIDQGLLSETEKFSEWGKKKKKKIKNTTLQDKDQYYMRGSLAWNKNTYILSSFSG